MQGKVLSTGGGIDTSDATATAEDIKLGKTAYVNNQKLTGTSTAKELIDFTATTNSDTYYKWTTLNGLMWLNCRSTSSTRYAYVSFTPNKTGNLKIVICNASGGSNSRIITLSDAITDELSTGNSLGAIAKEYTLAVTANTTYSITIKPNAPGVDSIVGYYE